MILDAQTIRKKELQVEFLKIETQKLLAMIKDPDVDGFTTREAVFMYNDKMSDLKILEKQIKKNGTIASAEET